VFLQTFNTPYEKEELSEILLEISSQTMTVDAYIRNECLVLLRVLLENQKDKMSVDLPKIVNKLCFLTLDRRSLDNVRDSALECLSKIVANTNINVDILESEKVLFVIKKILEKNEKLLKHTAVLTFGHLLSRNQSKLQYLGILSQIYPSEDVSGLDFCDLYTDDERKAMVSLATNNWKYLQDSSSQRLVVNFHLKTLEHDTFWEVKNMSALFWNSVFDQVRDLHDENEIVKYLEDHKFFTAVILGLSDYEIVVRTEFFKLLKKIESSGKLNFDNVGKIEEQEMEVNVIHKRKKTDFEENEDIDEEEINDILEVNDKTLIHIWSDRKHVESIKTVLPHQIRNISFQKFKQEICDIQDPGEDSRTDPETVLQSIIEDILQSSSEDCQLDLIDCY